MEDKKQISEIFRYISKGETIEEIKERLLEFKGDKHFLQYLKWMYDESLHEHKMIKKIPKDYTPEILNHIDICVLNLRRGIKEVHKAIFNKNVLDKTRSLAFYYVLEYCHDDEVEIVKLIVKNKIYKRISRKTVKEVYPEIFPINKEEEEETTEN